jgi:hypothetical protein
MLARKLPRSSPQAASLLRTFTTSLSRDSGRAPALSDLQPGGAEAYNARQKEFRDGLEAAKKRKEQADRQLLASVPKTPRPSSSDTPSSSASSSNDSRMLDALGLGSLSTATGEARQAETETTTTKRGPLSSLIYGTPEGRAMDKDMERSFSEVLARGKYVHSIVFHDVKPDRVDDYTELVGNWYPRMAKMPENKVNLVGSWRTEVGDCETFGEVRNTLVVLC